jgi:hypothetical protein
LLSKLCNVSKPHGVELNTALAQKVYGVSKDSSFIPIIRVVVQVMLKLLPQAPGLLHKFKAHCSEMHVCTPETMAFFCDRYSVTEGEVRRIEDLISSVDSLPVTLHIPELQVMFAIDN